MKESKEAGESDSAGLSRDYERLAIRQRVLLDQQLRDEHFLDLAVLENRIDAGL